MYTDIDLSGFKMNRKKGRNLYSTQQASSEDSRLKKTNKKIDVGFN